MDPDRPNLSTAARWVFIAILAAGCQKEEGAEPIADHAGAMDVYDIDGNRYPVVRIGARYWMAENLRTSRYRNNTPVPNVTLIDPWWSASTGAWCNYENDTAYDPVHGKLYNFHAVADMNGLCPQGWHVPSDLEWQQMELGLGMPPDEVAGIGLRGVPERIGGKLKSTAMWLTPNTGATNETGFSALPSGYRGPESINFVNRTRNGAWWTSTESTGAEAWCRTLSNMNAAVNRDSVNKRYGFCVRCVMD